MGNLDSKDDLLMKAQSSRDQMMVSESGFTVNSSDSAKSPSRFVAKVPRDTEKIANVLESKEKLSIASINEHRKQERERVFADQLQRIQRQVNSAQR